MRSYAVFVLLILASYGNRSVSAQDTSPQLSPIARVRLAAVHSIASINSGVGHGRVTYETAGQVVEQMQFRLSFRGDKYAVTAHYTLPGNRNKAINRQTIVSDGDLTFATRFFDSQKPNGYTTYVWRDRKSIGDNRFLVARESIFPYDPTKVRYGLVDVPRTFDKFEVVVVSSNEVTTQLAYSLNAKTKITFDADAHSGFNVTKHCVYDDEGDYHARTVGWDRKDGVWYVRRFHDQWFARKRLPGREERVRVLEYDDFQPNVDVDEKMFDLTGADKGSFNERMMNPHGPPPTAKEEKDRRLLSPVNVLK